MRAAQSLIRAQILSLQECAACCASKYTQGFKKRPVVLARFLQQTSPGPVPYLSYGAQKKKKKMVQVSRSPKLWSPNPPGQEEGFPWTLQIHTWGGGITSGRSSPSFLSTLKLLKPFRTQDAYLMGSPGHLLPPFVGFTLGKLGCTPGCTWFRKPPRYGKDSLQSSFHN